MWSERYRAQPAQPSGILDSYGPASIKSHTGTEVPLSDSKKTGSRDISDLKARLGLKKGGAASQTGATPRANGASGGVVPPPGLNLPPPPGLAPAAPPQPVIPN